MNKAALVYDIGTTTMEVALVDLGTGKIVSRVAERETASVYGLDVMSRITYVMKYENGAKEITETICKQMNQLGNIVCKQGCVKPECINKIIVVGNSVMMHLALGLPVTQLGQAPFVSAYEQAQIETAVDMGLEFCSENVKVIGVPIIKEHVGADAFCGIIHMNMHKQVEPTLFIDIGTNGEIAFANKGKIWVASTAAGPIFEGAGVRGGCVLKEGVITHVEMNDDLELTIYGKSAVAGICGSGVIDAITVMIEKGIIDATGCFCDDGHKLDYKWKKRIITEEGKQEFVLHTSNANLYALAKGNAKIFKELKKADKGYVAIEQKSIRNFQLGKGAISAGIKTVLREADALLEDVEKIYVAGAFGGALNVDNACKLGIFPKEVKGKIEQVGNSALFGAVDIANEIVDMETLYEIKKRVCHVDLANSSYFKEQYIKNIDFTNYKSFYVE